MVIFSSADAPPSVDAVSEEADVAASVEAAVPPSVEAAVPASVETDVAASVDAADVSPSDFFAHPENAMDNARHPAMATVENLRFLIFSLFPFLSDIIKKQSRGHVP